MRLAGALRPSQSTRNGPSPKPLPWWQKRPRRLQRTTQKHIGYAEQNKRNWFYKTPPASSRRWGKGISRPNPPTVNLCQRLAAGFQRGLRRQEVPEPEGSCPLSPGPSAAGLLYARRRLGRKIGMVNGQAAGPSQGCCCIQLLTKRFPWHRFPGGTFHGSIPPGRERRPHQATRPR